VSYLKEDAEDSQAMSYLKEDAEDSQAIWLVDCFTEGPVCGVVVDQVKLPIEHPF
jgi:hypothetical protein